MKILVTGSAGFIGFHLSKFLLNKNWEVIGLDNLNDYYDIELKNSRLEILEAYKNFKFYKGVLMNKGEPSLNKIDDYNGNESKQKRVIVRLVVIFCLIVGGILAYFKNNDKVYEVEVITQQQSNSTK